MNKYDRPVVKQVSRQWVRENCRYITPRDTGLLRLLPENNRKILRRNQIEILYPKFASTDRLNKRLKKLYELHVIDRVFPRVGLGQGSSQQHICLDRAGIILLNLGNYNKPIIEKNGIKTLYSGWEHKVKINDYECEITKLCNALNMKKEIYLVENPIIFQDKKLIPDIFCILRYKNKGYALFIEVDLGTEDIPYIQKKIDNYVDYYMSRKWLTEDWTKLFKVPTFPKILFFTEEKRTRWKHSLENYSKGLSIQFLFQFHSEFLKTMIKILQS